MRKLPVYIVVDTSESMYGEAVDQINRSLDNMLAALHRNPYAMETVWLSLISFDSTARVLRPLTELCEFTLPQLKSRPGTAMGTAIDLLCQQISREVRPASAEDKGDWRPIVFFLTDGQPTDNWRPALARLRGKRQKPANIYAIACGAEVDLGMLKEMADVVFSVKEANPEQISKLFIWMSAAIQSASTNVSEDGLSESDLHTPEGVVLVGDDYDEAPDHPLQLFFHGTCSTTKKKYLMRLKYLDEIEMYVPDKSMPIPDDFFSDGGIEPTTVSSDKIACMPTCPHCDNKDWACCSNCGAGFCFDHVKAERIGYVDCPECGCRLGHNPDETFDMTPSAG